MKIELPRKVVLIIKNLQRHGYDAYAVGGCVRDSILNRKPEDWDITTSAKPEQVKRIFRRTVDTGIEHGTVTVLIGKDGFEVTTYRVDGLYEDGRHPKEVTFTSRLEEDLKRRDFTINAMAYNDDERLRMHFGFCAQYVFLRSWHFQSSRRPQKRSKVWLRIWKRSVQSGFRQSW